MGSRPRLLLHCQHSLGLGHLVRALSLASGLSERFDVSILCGGEVPDTVSRPAGVELIELPALGGIRGPLVSRTPGVDPAHAHALRRELVLSALSERRPAAVVVELFPFGRKKLAGELVPLLEAARGSGAVTACSVRDLLVSRTDGGRHDDRASRTANDLLDAVLVHADPLLARLEDTFRPRTALAVPVHHTGFVVRPRRRTRQVRADSRPRVLVSAGGGRVGGALLRAAAQAHRLLEGVETTLVAGPFLAEEEWRSLPRPVPGLHLRRSVRELGAELAAATVSVSQCGYNTALDVLQAGLPALFVPFVAPEEDEQARRAAALARLGAARVLDPASLDGPRLADEIRRLLDFRPRPLELDLDGAATSARILEGLVRERSSPRAERAAVCA
ncbi:MAG TPA: glycosyltransferase [Gaiellaceae bacterium]|nr:glycosyltransferase [Gaiellaceae bacterium]